MRRGRSGWWGLRRSAGSGLARRAQCGGRRCRVFEAQGTAQMVVGGEHLASWAWRRTVASASAQSPAQGPCTQSCVMWRGRTTDRYVRVAQTSHRVLPSTIPPGHAAQRVPSGARDLVGTELVERNDRCNSWPRAYVARQLCSSVLVLLPGRTATIVALLATRRNVKLRGMTCSENNIVRTAPGCAAPSAV